jgi:hypothetical protein
VRSLPGLPQPDLQLTCLPVSNHAKLWTPLLQRKPTARLTVRIGHLQPRSRGWVKLRSTNPADAPLIQMNVFQDPYDLEAMVRGLKLSRELFKQSPLRDMIRNEMLPGPGNEDDAAIREHLARHPEKFDPRDYLKPATAAAKAICKQRYEEFGCAGQGSKIRPLSLSIMIDRYKRGELSQVIH